MCDDFSLSAVLTGSALGTIREYKSVDGDGLKSRIGQTFCGPGRSAWAPMPISPMTMTMTSGNNASDDDAEQDDEPISRITRLLMPLVAQRLAPHLVDLALQTLAIVYLLFFHVLALLALAFFLHLFADNSDF